MEIVAKLIGEFVKAEPVLLDCVVRGILDMNSSVTLARLGLCLGRLRRRVIPAPNPTERIPKLEPEELLTE